jgi:peptidoglycan hydrolase-like protein with peptidoglycan-binding domain
LFCCRIVGMDEKTSEAAEAREKASKTPTAPISVSTPDEEPKQTRAKSVGAKPATRKIAPGSVVSGDDTDPIKYSSAKPGPRKRVLTVLHIQRRLAEEGFAEAASAPGGTYEALTSRAVVAYQRSRGETPTGVLTRKQFAELFRGDPNVTVSIDTHADHEV